MTPPAPPPTGAADLLVGRLLPEHQVDLIREDLQHIELYLKSRGWRTARVEESPVDESVYYDFINPPHHLRLIIGEPEEKEMDEYTDDAWNWEAEHNAN